MKVPELKGGQMLTIAYIIGILIVLYIVYKVLGKIGLVKTKEKRKQETAVEDLRSVKQFSTKYLADKIDNYPQLGKLGKDYAVRLHDAIKGAGTDEETIFSIFSQLRSKENISEIAVYYKAAYQRDLLTDILNDLTDKEKATLMEIINKLPAK